MAERLELETMSYANAARHWSVDLDNTTGDLVIQFDGRTNKMVVTGEYEDSGILEYRVIRIE